jgi:predicted dehydrogenase
MENVVAMEGVEVGALADVNLAAAESFQRDFGGRYVTAEPARILEDPDIDAVIIATHP